MMWFIGVAKLLGIVAILAPYFPKIKEWAYAGFVFNLTGGLFSHIAVGDPINEWMRPLFILILLFGSHFLS
ncbi:MAG: DoxX family protein [Chitinophagaceae bacterium]